MTNKVIAGDVKEIVATDLPWDRFNNKTVLITGANGFLPAYMVETLLYLNNSTKEITVTVLALVRNIEKAKERFKSYADDKNLVYIVQDVATPIKIDSKIDFIIHAASQASPKYYGVDPVGTINANVLGTINLLELAREKKIEEFLFYSSGEVYGQIDDANNPVKEDYYGYLNPTNVRSCYAESKRMGENLCVSYHHQYGINTKIVRPFHTYGPGMQLDDGRVFADFVRDLVYERNIEMKSDGSARRAFCYLKDATIGFFTVMFKGLPAEPYNVGNPHEEHSIIELAEIMVRISKNPIKIIKKEIVPTNQYLKSPLIRNTPNIDKAKTLGWVPYTTAEEGFRKTVQSFIED
jgi:nucleoside-diphosphate-sugar epimerase